MRPGLVSVGVLFAVLAAGMLLAVNLSPSTSENRDWFTLPPQPVGGNATGAALIQGTDTASGTFELHWSATMAARVDLYAAPGCTAPAPTCATGTPLVGWASQASGNWSTSGDLRFPYLLVWSSPSGAPGTFSANALESSPGSPSYLALGNLVIDGGAATLALVGAVAIFLGLFLRGGVYRGPAPLVSRSAEDAAEIARGPPRP